MRLIFTIILLLSAFVSKAQNDSIFNDFRSAEKNPLAVKGLYIDGFKGNAIPKSVAKMTNMESMVIKHSSITEIPDFIGRLKKLKTLAFQYSKISKISDSISNLRHLERLEIVDARLTSIDSNVCTLTHLTHLNFLGNKISQISPTITNLTKLKMLNISTWDGEVFIDEKTKQMLIDNFKGKCHLNMVRFKDED